MATDANTLMAAAACYGCASPGQVQLMKLGLLQQILLANDPVADTSPTALLEAAKCFACLPPGTQHAIELALLLQIVEAGGTGGSGGVTCGAADPVAAPSGTCAIYYRTDTGTVFIWNGSAWI